MLLMLLGLGCPASDEKNTGDDSAPPINQNDTAPTSCDGTNPVINELIIEDAGVHDFEGEDSPTLKVSADASDDDGDLHRINLTLWWDDVVDGSVDTSGAGEESGWYEMNETPCGTFSATFGILFQVDGSRFEYETTYEFAGMVTDDAGLESNIAIDSGTTPAAL
jgi:hypothetical protein